MYLMRNRHGHPLIGGKRNPKFLGIRFPKLVAINGQQQLAYRTAMAA